ncbi:MAG TPA: hypothetical protein VNS19_10590 [Acidimicrobiales bacterium]|nr:hypothetical protein [Acidimicrobiales bacterium]
MDEDPSLHFEDDTVFNAWLETTPGAFNSMILHLSDIAPRAQRVLAEDGYEAFEAAMASYVADCLGHIETILRNGQRDLVDDFGHHLTPDERMEMADFVVLIERFRAERDAEREARSERERLGCVSEAERLIEDWAS